ncbi:polyprenyl synthetase family protein [Pseudarthrobacter sp. J75]|uniref:polyprenyl synthetase family protein n=1 Tax=unclassified Pseudarthrobacter TaxID=2647000 RepID=UPI002E80EC67|nr:MULTISPECIES: polyprenyl synthetase family protein [unclassified Pseudarthrobacter]MEE2521917.1 polyprenyl synthetase family protein [Pseudarthrobacter sp. J47]MEE2528842.1 polyprenyl synthetase family protein [Pseudarthrobacter sp. J75]
MNSLNIDQALNGKADVGLVEDELQRFFSESKLRAVAVNAGYLGLWEALERAAAGGKRSRPRLVMLAYRGLGGTDFTSAVQLAASYELLHTALLIHDDVIDRDFMRRGIPNVSGHYRSRAVRSGAPARAADHAGVSAGVLAGDLALSSAYRLVGAIESPAAVRQRLNNILDDAIFSSIGGEVLDIEFSRAPQMPALQDIIKTAHQKTSVYSFEAPLQAGAVLAGAAEQAVTALTSFGRYAGIAYQIADDVMGVFGKESRTGKASWGDLREGKRTVLLSYAATRPGWTRIADLLGSPDMSAADAESIRAELVSCGAKNYAIELATENAQLAMMHLESDGVPQSLRQSLERMLFAVIQDLGSP